MKESVNVFQYPTQVIFFSEYKPLCESVEFLLAHTRRVKTFTDPKALEIWLESQVWSQEAAPIRIEVNQLGPRRHFSLETDRIYCRAFDRHRFAVPAVLIVAKDNDKTDGLDLCKKLVDLPIKKILMLNKFRDFDSTDALNEGLIDQCIRTPDRDILSDLEIAIKNMEMRYFREQSMLPLQILVKAGCNFLTDKKFARLVEEMIAEHAFAEYYWFDDPNSILFVSADGECKLMVIETEASMINHLENAQDMGAPIELQDALSTFKVIPFDLMSELDSAHRYDRWEMHCQLAQRCDTRQPIFWALFDLPPKYHIGEIFSFNKYLQSAEQGL